MMDLVYEEIVFISCSKNEENIKNFYKNNKKRSREYI